MAEILIVTDDVVTQLARDLVVEVDARLLDGFDEAVRHYFTDPGAAVGDLSPNPLAFGVGEVGPETVAYLVHLCQTGLDAVTGGLAVGGALRVWRSAFGRRRAIKAVEEFPALSPQQCELVRAATIKAAVRLNRPADEAEHLADLIVARLTRPAPPSGD